MAIALAILSAIVYGAADFCGGLATRRTSSIAVVFTSQLLGLIVLLPLLPLAGGRASWSTIAWGAFAGVAGALGILFLYRALAVGRMGVVSPITAVIAAAIPVLAGFTFGERPAIRANAGIVLAVVAVVLISAAPDDSREGEGGIVLSLASGTAFGFFFILLARAGSHSGLWPLVGARAASCTIVAAVGASRGQSLLPARPAARTTALAGVLDMTANALYVLAAQRGLFAVVATLGSLYPASTVVLAAIVLRERLSRAQWVGAAAALGGVALIAG